MTAASLDLWEDWCSVTRTPPECRDDAVLRRFAKQTSASQRMLSALRPPLTNQKTKATAWPEVHHKEPDALKRLLRHGSVLANNRQTFWIERLRLRRMMFAAVLLAPADQGGLGLTRDRALNLSPDVFQELRPLIGTAVQEAACPACAVWSWLQILGTNASWSSAMVRSLAKRSGVTSENDAAHHHELDDPNPEWLDWADCPNLLPGIDRWGYLYRYSSMHRSSLSGVIAVMAMLLEAPRRQSLDPLPAPEPHTIRHVTPKEEAAILARADELNKRVAALLASFE